MGKIFAIISSTNDNTIFLDSYPSFCSVLGCKHNFYKTKFSVVHNKPNIILPVFKALMHGFNQMLSKQPESLERLVTVSGGTTLL